MSAYRRLLALLVVGSTILRAAPIPDQMAAARVLGPHWRVMSRVAGMIFSGTVLSIHAQPVDKRQTLPLVVTKFRVDQAIAGVRPGETLSIREWAGALDLQRAMIPGQRLLIFLYPPSRLGFTSPVGGRAGVVARDARGNVVLPPATQDERPGDSQGLACSAVEGTSRDPGIAISLRRHSDTTRKPSGFCRSSSEQGITLQQIERAILNARRMKSGESNPE
jgi:hypothetical protein